jgi:hypothetical protein
LFNLKTVLDRPNRDEKGQAFILVLVLMLFCSLIITPLTAYMFSGRIATTRDEVRMREQYAADAGVEDAIQKIRLNQIVTPGDLPSTPGASKSYSLGATINGKTVAPVTITYIDNQTFKVQSSTMTSASSGTSITSYIGTFNFYANLLYNAITSPASVTCGNNDFVNGPVQVPANGDGTNGAVQPPYSVNHTAPPWPTGAGMAGFYRDQVPVATPYTASTLDISVYAGPLYCTAPNLTITGTGSLTGVIYATGNVNIPTHGVSPLNLNTHAIFAEGSINFQPHNDVAGQGSIVANGDVNFQPNESPGAWVFVMSVRGTLNFQPQGGQGGISPVRWLVM